jgi:hypothetical protein
MLLGFFESLDWSLESENDLADLFNTKCNQALSPSPDLIGWRLKYAMIETEPGPIYPKRKLTLYHMHTRRYTPDRRLHRACLCSVQRVPP